MVWSLLFRIEAMQRPFWIVLASIYIESALTVLVNQTEIFGGELGMFRASASMQFASQADTQWASNPHFSHAKKTGQDFEVAPGPSLRLIVSARRLVLHAVRSDYHIVQISRPVRSPPLL